MSNKRPVTVADIIEAAGKQSLIVVDETGKVVADRLTTTKGWEMIGPCEVLLLRPTVKFKGGDFFEVFLQVAVDWEKLVNSPKL